MKVQTAFLLDIGKVIALDLDARASRPQLKQLVFMVLTVGFMTILMKMESITISVFIILMCGMSLMITCINNKGRDVPIPKKSFEKRGVCGILIVEGTAPHSLLNAR